MFILTSDFEGMPNALLEACALQIPCISTDCPCGPKDILEGGEKGILVNVGDYKELANQMAKLADDKKLRNNLSSKNKETGLKYSPELISDMWIDFIKSLL